MRGEFLGAGYGGGGRRRRRRRGAPASVGIGVSLSRRAGGARVLRAGVAVVVVVVVVFAGSVLQLVRIVINGRALEGFEKKLCAAWEEKKKRPVVPAGG